MGIYNIFSLIAAAAIIRALYVFWRNRLYSERLAQLPESFDLDKAKVQVMTERGYKEIAVLSAAALLAAFLAGSLAAAAVIVAFLGLWVAGACYVYSHVQPSGDTETKQDFTVKTVGSRLAISMLAGGGLLVAVLGMPDSGIGSVYALPSADYSESVPFQNYENWPDEKRLNFAAHYIYTVQDRPSLTSSNLEAIHAQALRLKACLDTDKDRPTNLSIFFYSAACLQATE